MQSSLQQRQAFIALMGVMLDELGTTTSSLARRLGTTEQSVRTWAESRLPNFDGCCVLAGPKCPSRVQFIRLLAGPGVVVELAQDDAERVELQRLSMTVLDAKEKYLFNEMLGVAYAAHAAFIEAEEGRIDRARRKAVIDQQAQRARVLVRRLMLIEEVKRLRATQLCVRE